MKYVGALALAVAFSGLSLNAAGYGGKASKPQVLIIGDSINLGRRSADPFKEGSAIPPVNTYHPELNAYSGDDLGSKSLLRREGVGKRFKVFECNQSGAGVQRSSECIQQFADDGVEPSKVRLIYHAVGTADFCRSPDGATLDGFSDRLAELADTYPAAAISISGPVPLPGLNAIGDQPIKLGEFATTCNMWHRILCPELVTSAERWPELNQKFKAAVSEFKASYPDRAIIYRDLASSAELLGGMEFLASDCFHPNKEGQKKIAEELHRVAKVTFELKYPKGSSSMKQYEDGRSGYVKSLQAKKPQGCRSACKVRSGCTHFFRKQRQEYRGGYQCKLFGGLPSSKISGYSGPYQKYIGGSAAQ